MNQEYPNLTITFVIEYNNQFLLIKRAPHLKNYPNLWAFPGGKVEIGETIIQTIVREVMEETGLEINDQAAFLDTYWFGKTVGAAFLVRAKENRVKKSEESSEFVWIANENELNQYDYIPGIETHLNRAIEKVQKNEFDSLEKMNLTESKYNYPKKAGQ